MRPPLQTPALSERAAHRDILRQGIHHCVICFVCFAGVTKAALETLAGTEAVNADTTVTTTALQGTIDASRLDRPIPDAVSVVADRTATQGTYEWKSWRPRFTYQIGANYGLPVGLATVTDTSGK